MPPYDKQVKKYERRPLPGNPAQTEAWALLEAARRMAVSITHDGPDEKATKEARKAALRLNWRLWTIFQAELVVEKPEIPQEIRINMLTLCNFVDKHTVGALARPTPEALAVLIEINRNIAAGLAQVPPSDEARAVKAAEAANQQAPGGPPPDSKPIDVDA